MELEKKQHVTLGEISEIQTGPFGSQLHASDYKDRGTPIITVEHLGDNEVLHQNLPLVGAADRQRLAKYSLHEGDIVFTRVGAIDRRAYVSSREDGWLFSGRLLRVRSTCNTADGRFLSHLLGSHDAVHWIRNHAVGSTMACLNTSILSSVPLDLPSIFEQRRIAEILDTLDEAIRKTEQLIAKQKQVKQGLLHDLLTYGIDENGAVRDPEYDPRQFKDSPLGRIPNEWDIQPLEALALDPICYGIVQAGPYVPGGPHVLTIGDLKGDFRSGLHRTDPRIDQQYSRSRTRAGDVLLAIKGTIGRVAVVPSWYEGNISRDLARLRFTPSILPDFFSQYLQSPIGQRRIELSVVGTTRAEVSIRVLKQFMIPVAQKQEQIEITRRLELLDSRIATDVSAAKKLRLLKQGLMEDLLTGRVPVTPLLSESTP